MTVIDQINVSIPDDGLGDFLRDAFLKCNANFNALNEFKSDLVDGKIVTAQIPVVSKLTVSNLAPTGIPANGDTWIIYNG